MKLPLLFAVAVWSLICLGMIALTTLPAHSYSPNRNNHPPQAYVPDTAYALPQNHPDMRGQGGHYNGSHYNNGNHYQPQPQVQHPANYKPWTADPLYQQELNLIIRQSALKQRQLKERYTADMARLDAQRMQNTNSHISSLERLSERDNRRYTDYGTIASRQVARDADYRSRVAQVKMTLETNQLREQQNLTLKISSLDETYGRKWGSRR